ncbi:uncharacterized protein LOC133845144 [Drosophila sulfurigaster albostrigata]|uniref:uncharacterized protein LOC133845144 n=1 Tax=Drosophila sulfurigaster albostrigata TaxID=89887 RepID=UPI002D21B3D2|nr:uncharacterized protein LOC133845144 [Drosophila sulfurigaster albostrigata]
MKFSLRIFLMFIAWRLCPAVQLLPNMGYFIVVQQFECVVNEQFITKASCDVVTPRNRSINAELVLLQPFKALGGSVKVSIPKKRVFTQIFDITFELCKVLRERKRKALIDIIHSLANMGSKHIHCPLLEGHYKVQNVTIADSLPPLLTESPFLLQFTWFLPRVATVMNVTVLAHLYDISREHNGKKKYF